MPPPFVRLKVPAAIVLLAVTASLLPLVLSSAAAAAPPQPETPRFGKAIEGYAAYEGNTVCDPVDRRGTTKLAHLIRTTYGTDESIGISRNECYTPSEHNDGRALDWMIDVSSPPEKAKADTFLDWLLATDKHGNTHAMARRLGVMYIIFNRHMWRAYGDPGWSRYDGTNPHTDHIHISLSYDGASGRTSFWTGQPLAPSCATVPLTSPSPRVVTDPMRYVPVTATRVASTESGARMVDGPCRLFASTPYSSNRLDVPVSGVASVPSEGVAAVALQVSMRKPTWDSYVTAGPAGGAISDVRRVSAAANRSSSSLVVLPVGADGKVSFFTNLGATDLIVNVVGYYIDPNAPLRVRRKMAVGGGDMFDAVTPNRAYSAVRIGRSGRFKAAIGGTAGTDPASSAAVVSVTVDKGKGSGNLFVYPAGADRPKSALLSYGRDARTVQTVIPLGRNGSLMVENSGSAARAVDLDIVGAYEPAALPGGRGFASRRQPKTVVDTAKDLGLQSLRGGATKDFSVAGLVTTDTTAVLLEVTGRKPRSDAALTFWRPGRGYPGTTDMTVGAGDTVTGTIVAPVSRSGRIRVRNAGASGMDVRIAVLGVFR
jgi:hypothetical protein